MMLSFKALPSRSQKTHLKTPLSNLPLFPNRSSPPLLYCHVLPQSNSTLLLKMVSDLLLFLQEGQHHCILTHVCFFFGNQNISQQHPRYFFGHIISLG